MRICAEHFATFNVLEPSADSVAELPHRDSRNPLWVLAVILPIRQSMRRSA